MRWTSLLVALITLAVLPGCPSGKKGGSATTVPVSEMPAAVKTYAALRFVPADASYAVVGKSATDLTTLLGTLAEVLGIVGDFDPDEISGGSREAFGYDITSADSLAGIGLDVTQGTAIWSTGLSPTFAIGLSDPARFEGFIEQMRERGVSIQSQIVDGAEVFSIRFDDEVLISWVALDGWMLARFELLPEKQPELGWLTSARAAAGALGGHADFLAAMELDGDAPVVGVVRPRTIVETFVNLLGREEGAQTAQIVGACAAPLREIDRGLLSARIGAEGGGATLALDLSDRSRVESNVVPASPGWYATRQGAPVQLDVGLDVVGFLRGLGGCPSDVGELAQLGVRTAHVAVQAFEDDLPSRAGAYADLTTDQHLRGMIQSVRGIGMFSKKRTHSSGIEVVDIKVPMFLSLTYHLSPTLGLAAMGDGQLDALLATGGEVRTGELLRIDLRPHDVPTDAWDLLLANVLDVDSSDARERTIRRLRRWDHGVIDARLDGDRITITASGDRHQ